ncbi:MAG: hypothetical protein D4R64_06460 [Porphyromonadaceae bacterium]|nr:MAG: hypothetical protein D4R64_06460 [Porphyromonadaceae bacterium]
MESGPIPFQKKTGHEEIFGDHRNHHLIDFWQWAYSDLIGNTERGSVAEYLVALACNVDSKPRISWDAFDLQLENGIKIEVKSSGYLQTWKQKDYSKPIFRIPKTYAWDYNENIYERNKKRQADVYVFALHAHKDHGTINPLDTRQWEFYILSSRILDVKVGEAKQISLEKLLKIGAIMSNFDDLLRNIESALSNG